MKHLHTYLLLGAVMCACSDEPAGGEEEITGPDPVINSTVTVLEYNPAPGQFINEMPEYEPGDTQATMTAKVQKCLDNGELVSLGAWGGSITLKLNKSLSVAKTGYDFRVLGNSYTTGNDGDRWWGSSEPGIIWVMEDTNGNGQADDTWYMIPVPGVEIYADEVMYKRLDDGTASYKTSYGFEGVLTRNAAYHTQPFWPQWINGDVKKCRGLRLADNGVFDPATQKYIQYCYPNCADSYPNSMDASAIAVRDAGAPIKAVDFVRITTGVLQVNGPMGECSTEICGIKLLHN